MTVFRWIMFVLATVLAGGWVLMFVLNLVRGDGSFDAIVRWLRHWATLTVLLWFNLEVWGRVIWTLITW